MKSESEMIREVLRIRMVEEEIARRYPSGVMRTPVHLSVGQEAQAVGVCAALTEDDECVSTHRSHAHYLAKGGDLNALIAELYGKATGCSGGHGGSMHLTDTVHGFRASTSIVGGTIPVGVGLAFAKRMRRKPGVAVVFLGDGALETGVFHESANFASLHQLPVVFVCENNQYSCQTPIALRQGFRIEKLSRAYRMRTFELNTKNLLLIRDCMHRARLQTPSFVLLPTTRHYEHCGPKRIITERFPYKTERTWFAEIKTEIDAAFAAAQAAAPPTQMSMYAD